MSISDSEFFSKFNENIIAFEQALPNQANTKTAAAAAPLSDRAQAMKVISAVKNILPQLMSGIQIEQKQGKLTAADVESLKKLALGIKRDANGAKFGEVDAKLKEFKGIVFKAFPKLAEQVGKEEDFMPEGYGHVTDVAHGTHIVSADSIIHEQAGKSSSAGAVDNFNTGEVSKAYTPKEQEEQIAKFKKTLGAQDFDFDDAVVDFAAMLYEFENSPAIADAHLKSMFDAIMAKTKDPQAAMIIADAVKGTKFSKDINRLKADEIFKARNVVMPKSEQVKQEEADFKTLFDAMLPDMKQMSEADLKAFVKGAFMETGLYKRDRKFVEAKLYDVFKGTPKADMMTRVLWDEPSLKPGSIVIEENMRALLSKGKQDEARTALVDGLKKYTNLDVQSLKGFIELLLSSDPLMRVNPILTKETLLQMVKGTNYSFEMGKILFPGTMQSEVETAIGIAVASDNLIQAVNMLVFGLKKLIMGETYQQTIYEVDEETTAKLRSLALEPDRKNTTISGVKLEEVTYMKPKEVVTANREGIIAEGTLHRLLERITGNQALQKRYPDLKKTILEAVKKAPELVNATLDARIDKILFPYVPVSDLSIFDKMKNTDATVALIYFRNDYKKLLALSDNDLDSVLQAFIKGKKSFTEDKMKFRVLSEINDINERYRLMNLLFKGDPFENAKALLYLRPEGLAKYKEAYEFFAARYPGSLDEFKKAFMVHVKATTKSISDQIHTEHFLNKLDVAEVEKLRKIMVGNAGSSGAATAAAGGSTATVAGSGSASAAAQGPIASARPPSNLDTKHNK